MQYYIWTPRDPLSVAFLARTTYYYCLLLADGSLPVMDILSSCHEGVWIQGRFNTFNCVVCRVNDGRSVTMSELFLIHASIQSFNDGVQFHTYLQLTYHILCGRCNKTKIDTITFLSLCASHMLTAMSMRSFKAEAKNDCRTQAMTFFAGCHLIFATDAPTAVEPLTSLEFRQYTIHKLTH